MKIRTPDCRCLICTDQGEVILWSHGPTTLHAIKSMRRLIDAMIDEKNIQEAEPCPS